jgi:thiol-disulfide isomerase/thioredoxin
MSIPGITANLKTSDFQTGGSGNVYVNKKITNGEPGILLIHASWCGHCKRFTPTYQGISQKLNKNRLAFPCVAIESEELKKDNGQLSKALSIEGYPTIKFFDQNGKIIGDYNGGRDEKEILNNICDVYHHCVAKH